MKKIILIVLPLLFFCFSCENKESETDVPTQDKVAFPEKDELPLSDVEKDALKVADLMCQTRGLVARLHDGNKNAIKELEEFEHKNKIILRELLEKYPIHTEEGTEFMQKVNKELESCEFNPL